MKVTMKLTLDGLVRALRARVHAMADDIESGYAEAGADAGGRRAEPADERDGDEGR